MFSKPPLSSKRSIWGNSQTLPLNPDRWQWTAALGERELRWILVDSARKPPHSWSKRSNGENSQASSLNPERWKWIYIYLHAVVDLEGSNVFVDNYWQWPNLLGEKILFMDRKLNDPKDQTWTDSFDALDGIDTSLNVSGKKNKAHDLVHFIYFTSRNECAVIHSLRFFANTFLGIARQASWTTILCTRDIYIHTSLHWLRTVLIPWMKRNPNLWLEGDIYRPAWKVHYKSPGCLDNVALMISIKRAFALFVIAHSAIRASRYIWSTNESRFEDIAQRSSRFLYSVFALYVVRLSGECFWLGRIVEVTCWKGLLTFPWWSYRMANCFHGDWRPNWRVYFVMSWNAQKRHVGEFLIRNSTGVFGAIITITTFWRLSLDCEKVTTTLMRKHDPTRGCYPRWRHWCF